jgi:FkbM family methyltransferase
MLLAGRPIDSILKAPFERRHWTAAANMFHRYPHSIAVLKRYLLARGPYPTVLSVNTPQGLVPFEIYSHHDLLTINEIFCRLDYRAAPSDHVIVDFGSNIGISAAYFLTTAPQAHAYLFEPLPTNFERLRKNLQPFASRYTLAETAVGTSDGEVEFGWEPTGRYGGVGQPTGNYITVPCIDSNKILEDVIQKHGAIDVLKVDIETLEEAVTIRIPDHLRPKIKRIYVEFPFTSNPLAQTHTFTQYGTVAQFILKTQLAKTN